MLSFILLLFYYSKFTRYAKGWQQLYAQKNSYTGSFFNENYGFSVIIPCRNEAKNLIRLFKSIENQTYSPNNFEVIFIDDHSSDETLGLLKQFREKQELINISILELKDHIKDNNETNSFKKEALKYGIDHAKFEYIITTDGDCVFSKNWIDSFNNYLNSSLGQFPKLISAPVKYIRGTGFFNRWLCLEYGILNSIGAADIALGTPSMANGANLCFSKAVYDEVEGYEGISECASGDDELLLHKIAKRYPNQIGFLANNQTIVETDAPENFKKFIQQRLRWTSKTRYYKNKTVTRTLIFAWITYLIILFESLFYLYYGIILQNIIVIISPFFIFYFKYYCEKQLISESLKLYQLDDLRKKIGFISSTLHLFYSLYIGLISRFIKRYEWKDRKVI